MYRTITRHIRVTVEPRYLEAESNPSRQRWVWAYAVEIINMGPETVQLRERIWRIADEGGQPQEVRGPGVVGEQPVLGPGERFTYTSACVLQAPSGMMVGQYGMVTDDGETFWVEIPAFSLDAPHAARVVN